MISLVESFLYPDKLGTLKESQRIERPNWSVTTNNYKGKCKSPKNWTQNIAYRKIYFERNNYESKNR